MSSESVELLVPNICSLSLRCVCSSSSSSSQPSKEHQEHTAPASHPPQSLTIHPPTLSLQLPEVVRLPPVSATFESERTILSLVLRTDAASSLDGGLTAASSAAAGGEGGEGGKGDAAAGGGW